MGSNLAGFITQIVADLQLAQNTAVLQNLVKARIRNIERVGLGQRAEIARIGHDIVDRVFDRQRKILRDFIERRRIGQNIRHFVFDRKVEDMRIFIHQTGIDRFHAAQMQLIIGAHGSQHIFIEFILIGCDRKRRGRGHRHRGIGIADQRDFIQPLQTAQDIDIGLNIRHRSRNIEFEF